MMFVSSSGNGPTANKYTGECGRLLSIKIYFSSNEKQLQYNKCYSTWKATREALRSLKQKIRDECRTHMSQSCKRAMLTKGSAHPNLSSRLALCHYISLRRFAGYVTMIVLTNRTTAPSACGECRVSVSMTTPSLLGSTSGNKNSSSSTLSLRSKTLLFIYFIYSFVHITVSP